jgi:hypothetical protein
MIRRSARRSAVCIILAGLLLIVLQMAAKITIGLGWVGKDACRVSGDDGSYIGLVVMCIGAVMLTFISSTSLLRAQPGSRDGRHRLG